MTVTNEPVKLYGSAFTADPYRTYRELREQGPLHKVEFPSGVIAWLVTGYDAALERLTDNRMGKNHCLGNGRWRARASIMPEPQHSRMQAHLLHQDPPQHSRMRRPVTHAFRSSLVEQWKPHIELLCRKRVELLDGRTDADLVSDFAVPYVFSVLCFVLGLPVPLATQFDREWCKAVQPVGPGMPGRGDYIRLLSELEDFIDTVISIKSEERADDLLTMLIVMHEHGELTTNELRSMVFQLLVAGQEPVTNMISTAFFSLLTHPDQLSLFVCGALHTTTAVEELLRFDGSFELTTWRFFRESTRVHGVMIPAGDSVIVSLAAANRDPQRFANPDVLQLSRDPNPHIAFGYGAHYCPAASLARLEVTVALTTIFQKFPSLALAVPPESVEWIPAVLSRGVQQLPVTLTKNAQTAHCSRQTT